MNVADPVAHAAIQHGRRPAPVELDGAGRVPRGIAVAPALPRTLLGRLRRAQLRTTTTR